MADVLVLDWLEEYDSLTESEIHTYASEQEHNHEVMIALYVILQEPSMVKNGSDLIAKICKQLLSFYRSGEKQLKKFAMQYIPSLITLHLAHRGYNSAVKALLLSLYNMEVVDSDGQPRVKSFRVPSIAQSSLFHDSNNLVPAFTAENSLRRLEECNTKLVSWGPLPQIDSINAQNRQKVVTALVFLYNQQLSAVSTHGLEYTCKAVSKLVSQGFQTEGSKKSMDSESLQSSITPRIVVSNQLLLEVLHIVYHSLERDVHGAGQALHDIAYRARYEAYPDVLLMCNAVQNLLHRSPASSLAPRPSSKHSVAKSMITNASFRTKKLPDDIPIQEQEAAETSLDSIVEESEGADNKGKFRGRSGSALKHLPKLPGLSKKPKNKNSPTPPRQSIDMESNVEIRMAGGDQANFQDSPTSDNQTVLVTTV